MQQDPIDTEWFLQQLSRLGRNQSDLARTMGIDKSAVSRLLKGERKMSAEDQDAIADFLGVTIREVAMRRGTGASGFGENKQAAYIARDSRDNREEDNSAFRHPIFGCMKGTMTIPPDLDLTAPIDDVEWSDKIYNE
jgi:transcriptional regulator with XRE-family HTH domain